MKRISLLTVLLGLASSPAGAYVTTDDVIASQQKEIEGLMKRLDAVENELMYVHAQRVAAIPSTTSVPQETPSQAFDRIHAESQHNDTAIQTQNNSAEIYRMEHAY